MKKTILILLTFSFTLSPIYAWAALTQTEVSQLYVSLLGRSSEGNGNIFWMNATDMEQAASSMLDCKAVKSYFGTALDSNQAFIEHIYLNTLGKTYTEDKTGVDFWVSALNSGLSKGVIVTSLINALQSPDSAGAAQNRFNNTVEVSNYCADMVAVCTDPDTFAGFITNVTDDDATITTAMELIDIEAQKLSFAKTFGGTDYESGSSVQQTLDGGYIILGTIRRDNSDSDVYLIKTDNSGNEIWSKIFDNGRCGSGRSVLQTDDGGYIIAGGGDFNLIKTDSTGNEIWSKDFGVFRLLSIQHTSDGGYLITGKYYTNDFIQVTDVCLIETDSNGNEIWSKNLGGTEIEYTVSVQQTTDGGYVIAGGTTLVSGTPDIYLIKTDSNGNEIWSKTFGGINSAESAYSMQQTVDGGYIIAGYTCKYENGRADIYLIKTDSNGNEIWSKTFGDTRSNCNYGYSMQQTTDGGYIITGSAYPYGTTLLYGSDVYLVKTDNSGNETWSKTIGGIGTNDSGSSVRQTLDGGYIIVGITTSNKGGSDIYLIKTDSNGNLNEE